MKSVEWGAVQDFVKHITSLVEEATLVYALVTVMGENNLGCGPMMKCREVNLHDIDKDFMDEFIAGVDHHGLQNTLLANAMDVGVHKQDVNLDSLLPTQSTAFTNHVVWQLSTTKSKSTFGNHHFHYMCNKSKWVMAYHQYQKAKEMLAAGPVEAKATLYRDSIIKAQTVVEQGSMWLMCFLNMGKHSSHTKAWRGLALICAGCTIIQISSICMQNVLS